ncbi:MAG: hypothetical protein UHN59_04705 [Bacteroidales bacterium]|nr:hypothetical protein [Bacteroidales bacterium]
MMHGKELNNDDNANSNHNFFFSQIVEDDDDFVGYVAYTIYKKNKIEYIEQFKKDNSRHPTDTELLNWQHGECTEGKMKNYRSLAEDKVNRFVNQLHGEVEKDLKKQKEKNDKKENNNRKKEKELTEKEKILNKREKSINERDKYCNVKSKCQFGSGILQSFIATLIYVVLGFIFIKCGGVDLLSELINTTSK